MPARRRVALRARPASLKTSARSGDVDGPRVDVEGKVFGPWLFFVGADF